MSIFRTIDRANHTTIKLVLSDLKRREEKKKKKREDKDEDEEQKR